MKTYFFRTEQDDNTWYRLDSDDLDWNFWFDYAEVVELQSDGCGKYIRCKEMPIKEDTFYKIPETMSMIALQAQPRNC